MSDVGTGERGDAVFGRPARAFPCAVPAGGDVRAGTRPARERAREGTAAAPPCLTPPTRHVPNSRAGARTPERQHPHAARGPPCAPEVIDSEDYAMIWTYARWLCTPVALRGRFEHLSFVVHMRCRLAEWIDDIIEVAADALTAEHARFRTFATLLSWTFYELDEFFGRFGVPSFEARAEALFQQAVARRAAPAAVSRACFATAAPSRPAAAPTSARCARGRRRRRRRRRRR